MTDWLTAAEWEAVRLSLRVALWATAVSLPFGIFVAYALARWRFPGREVLNIVVHLPLIMPPVVTGYLLLLTFGTQGPVGGFLDRVFGVTFAFRWTGAALASGVMAFPFLVRAVRLSIEAVDPKLEEAAATLGATRTWIFLTVTLPLIVPGILAGTVLAFAKGMGEFGATITFVSNIPGQTQTIPLAIDLALETPGGGARAARLAVLSVALAALALAVSEWVSRRVAARIGGRDA
ncbi:molybdate ABC transporter permease subunit [Salibaculum griseiflavum]|uniref:Molybdenum transport system permease n=1 Tax=Salibaculum griseiflavum TaxID=1914409 RepID=A0A2V1P4H5_9RHOB|nr:molybdate ABC transporter permease subunit [Salibaculum griseiflavum]PWG17383.1 molybdate ABC transporter permease subunit [Salibaculum griseiflavum]